MANTVWGAATQSFYTLSPERVLAAVETLGTRCTGRCLALNSLENRVYEVELEISESDPSYDERFRVVKFYRPGRWSREQILEEHQFLKDLIAADISVVPPLTSEGGETLFTLPPLEGDDAEIYFTVFPKVRGRCLDELTEDQLAQIGRLLARLHNVAASRPFQHRLSLDLRTYGEENLEGLLSSETIPENLRPRYQSIAQSIFESTAPRFSGIATQRIHGDAHSGNLLWNQNGPYWVDFDDTVTGPVVQDLWLLVPGRDEESNQRREKLLKGYREMRRFNEDELVLVESLRALRMIHFSAWIAKRWSDPSFPRTFPDFGSERWWVTEIQDLSGQLELIRGV